MSNSLEAKSGKYRVLFANPRFPRDTFWSFDRALALAGRRAVMPPLGLLTIAGMLSPQRYSVELADENLNAISDDALRAADVVFATAMIVQEQALFTLVERCRALGTPVVVGGPFVSGCFEVLLERGFQPHVWFLGEAEQLLPSLLEDLESGRLRRAYAHVADEARGCRVRMAFGADLRLLVAARPALELAPLPRFDLLDLPRYHSMAIQASRGCPIGCEFCDIWTQYGRKPRPVGRSVSAPRRTVD